MQLLLNDEEHGSAREHAVAPECTEKLVAMLFTETEKMLEQTPRTIRLGEKAISRYILDKLRDKGFADAAKLPKGADPTLYLLAFLEWLLGQAAACIDLTIDINLAGEVTNVAWDINEERIRQLFQNQNPAGRALDDRRGHVEREDVSAGQALIPFVPASGV